MLTPRRNFRQVVEIVELANSRGLERSGSVDDVHQLALAREEDAARTEMLSEPEISTIVLFRHACTAGGDLQPVRDTTDLRVEALRGSR